MVPVEVLEEELVQAVDSEAMVGLEEDLVELEEDLVELVEEAVEVAVDSEIIIMEEVEQVEDLAEV